MTDTDRPSTTDDDIDRTGRDEEVTGGSARTHSDKSPAFGTPETPAEQIPKGHDNDFA